MVQYKEKWSIVHIVPSHHLALPRRLRANLQRRRLLGGEGATDTYVMESDAQGIRFPSCVGIMKK